MSWTQEPKASQMPLATVHSFFKVISDALGYCEQVQSLSFCMVFCGLEKFPCTMFTGNNKQLIWVQVVVRQLQGIDLTRLGLWHRLFCSPHYLWPRNCSSDSLGGENACPSRWDFNFKLLAGIEKRAAEMVIRRDVGCISKPFACRSLLGIERW